MDLAWLSLLALLAVVVVSCTTRVNPGVVAIVLAWAIVALAGPWFNSSLGLKALWEAFPGELFLTLLGVSLLFSQAEANGTLVRVADAAQQLCGGNKGLLPIMFFVLALGLGTAGPGNIAVAGDSGAAGDGRCAPGGNSAADDGPYGRPWCDRLHAFAADGGRGGCRSDPGRHGLGRS